MLRGGRLRRRRADARLVAGLRGILRPGQRRVARDGGPPADVDGLREEERGRGVPRRPGDLVDEGRRVRRSARETIAPSTRLQLFDGVESRSRAPYASRGAGSTAARETRSRAGTRATRSSSSSRSAPSSRASRRAACRSRRRPPGPRRRPRARSRAATKSPARRPRPRRRPATTSPRRPRGATTSGPARRRRARTSPPPEPRLVVPMIFSFRSLVPIPRSDPAPPSRTTSLAPRSTSFRSTSSAPRCYLTRILSV